MVCWIYCLINFLIFYFEMFWENFNKFKINYLLKYEIDKYIIFCFVLYIYELKIWIKLNVLLYKKKKRSYKYFKDRYFIKGR